MALFCQGNERISIFYNKGNGQFDDEKILLKLSPVMGSSYIEMHDPNNNVELDLLVSNGHNWDYSSVPKPYHGFRIYENKGNGVFSQEKGSLKFRSVIYNTLSECINSLNSTLLKVQSVFNKSPHTFLIFPFITSLSPRPWLTILIG